MADAFVTPQGRLRYARNLWAARRFQNNPANAAKFGCSLIISKSDPEAGNLILKFNEVANTIEGTQPGVPGQMSILPYGKKSCLMDGSVRFPGDAFYADKLILGCSRAEEDGGPKVFNSDNTPVIDKGAIYDGCDARIHLNFYPYKGGSGGVNAGLYAVLKTGDNERIGNADPDSTSAFAGYGGAPVPVAPVAQPAQPGGVTLAQPGQPGVVPQGQYPQQPAPVAPQFQQPVQPQFPPADPNATPF